jgi:hypothetical protein
MSFFCTAPLGTMDLLQNVPRASLVGPSHDAGETEVAPVPRVSLVAATHAIDPSKIPPGPSPSLLVSNASELPTLGPITPATSPVPPVYAARDAPSAAVTLPPAHAAPARRAAGVRLLVGGNDAPASTLPGAFSPHRARDPARGRVPFAPAIPSSRREIVTGLAIGVAVSLLLGLLGQAYLESRSLARSQASRASALLAAQPTAPSPSGMSPSGMSPSGMSLPAVSLPAVSPVSPPVVPAGGEPPVQRLQALHGRGASEAPYPRDRTGEASGTESVRARPAREPLERRAPRAQPVRARAASPASESLPRAASARSPSRLSPSEQAGLGTELSLSD